MEEIVKLVLEEGYSALWRIDKLWAKVVRWSLTVLGLAMLILIFVLWLR